MKVFLNGTAMSGGADHASLKGAPLLGPARTAPRYRFYAVGDRFPGLVPVDSGGASIEGELYDLDDDVWLHSLLPNEPPELEAGVIELDDGGAAHAMILRLDRVLAPELHEITEYGGWRAYHAAHGRRAP